MSVILLQHGARNLVSFDREVIIPVLKEKHYHSNFSLKGDMHIQMLLVFDDDFLNCVELLKRVQPATELKKRDFLLKKRFELRIVREDFSFLS